MFDTNTSRIFVIRKRRFKCARKTLNLLLLSASDGTVKIGEEENVLSAHVSMYLYSGLLHLTAKTIEKQY